MSTLTRDTFDAHSNAVQATALSATRLAASSLPSDLSFHRSIDPLLGRDVDALSTRVLELTNRLIQLTSKTSPAKVSSLQGEEDVVDEFAGTVIDAMESMLERTDSALDDFMGTKKNPANQLTVSSADLSNKNDTKKFQPPFRGRLDPTLTHASYLPKPQLKFRYAHPNTDESPYIPVTLIPHKWCAKVPLGYIFDSGPSDNEDIVQGGESAEGEEKKRSLHPYYYELTHPTYPYHVFQPPLNPVRPTPLEVSSSPSSASRHFTLVSTAKAFLSFANAISSATELAVDLEHHSYRSYRGFLALMQVSTREEDFVIDLLVPEIREGLRQAKGKSFGKVEDEQIAKEAGEIVARVFADPSVVKVFHGAESDVVWLQQDFNIFIVGLFDTFHASKVLGFPKHSLANLLETYCDFVPDKRYQLADWRIRPLPAEMLTYAQSDTHFLLYIYDRLRGALLDKAQGLPPSDPNSEAESFIRIVLSRSARTSLRLHDIEAYDGQGGSGSGGWDTLARKWNKAELTAAGGQSFRAGDDGARTLGAVYRAVHHWREQVAREEDESTRFVLPTHHLFLISERPPSSVSDLLSYFGRPGGGAGAIPPVLKRRGGELVSVVKTAVGSVTPVGPSQSHSVVISELATKDIKQLPPSNDTEPTRVVATSTELRMWSSPASPLLGAASRSLLFSVDSSSATKMSSAAAKPYITPHSSLLGDASRPNVLAPQKLDSVLTPDTASDRFREIVNRIHRTLAIAPMVSAPATVNEETGIIISTGDASNTVPSDTGNSPAVPCEPLGQIETPTVTAHHQPHPSAHTYMPIIDDAIVVVGQASARQRKRKREKSSGDPSQSTLQTDSETKAELVAFDYTAVPNLLDGGGKREGGGEVDVKNKKPRQSKSESYSSGNFFGVRDGRFRFGFVPYLGALLLSL
ncbi:ribonuclease H-like domain-containing protein [Scleroderma yunnanense]